MEEAFKRAGEGTATERARGENNCFGLIIFFVQELSVYVAKISFGVPVAMEKNVGFLSNILYG